MRRICFVLACVDTFYDLIIPHGFRPLILNPTRITPKSATLIDNIVINDLSCFSNGGNIMHSISDHCLQFAQIDIFENLMKTKIRLNMQETGKLLIKMN